jgi:hypothetical protein
MKQQTLQLINDLIKDFVTIAKNLGFSCEKVPYIVRCFGDKQEIYLNDGSVLFEYKFFKNGNMHIKFNKEFSKAFNVEASRLLGWIKSKEDIKK